VCTSSWAATWPKWAEEETRQSKMVFIGIELPKDIFLQGLEQCLV
jgi:G3E family GTPase